MPDSFDPRAPPHYANSMGNGPPTRLISLSDYGLVAPQNFQSTFEIVHHCKPVMNRKNIAVVLLRKLSRQIEPILPLIR